MFVKVKILKPLKRLQIYKNIVPENMSEVLKTGGNPENHRT
jgi:hypothetical protein